MISNINNIAILGATSQIARDLVISFSGKEGTNLHLFARCPDDVRKWLAFMGLSAHYTIDEFSKFPKGQFDAVINFVGVGNPAQAQAIGSNIFEITQYFDDMVLAYLKLHPNCRYLFLSSGAAYGSGFNEPATQETFASVNINRLEPYEWYGVAKLYAECRHRSRKDLSIIDIRVFNYFSHTQDMNALFLITDILRAIRDNTVLKTSIDCIVRDYIHSSDFYNLVVALLASPAINTSVDCYSKAPIDKITLLAVMQKEFGLSYEIVNVANSFNPTGCKSHYYSLSKRAKDFGYNPLFTSLEGVVLEMGKVLEQIK